MPASWSLLLGPAGMAGPARAQPLRDVMPDKTHPLSALTSLHLSRRRRATFFAVHEYDNELSFRECVRERERERERESLEWRFITPSNCLRLLR